MGKKIERWIKSRGRLVIEASSGPMWERIRERIREQRRINLVISKGGCGLSQISTAELWVHNSAICRGCEVKFNKIVK